VSCWSPPENALRKAEPTRRKRYGKTVLQVVFSFQAMSTSCDKHVQSMSFILQEKQALSLNSWKLKKKWHLTFCVWSQ